MTDAQIVYTPSASRGEMRHVFFSESFPKKKSKFIKLPPLKTMCFFKKNSALIVNIVSFFFLFFVCNSFRVLCLGQTEYSIFDNEYWNILKNIYIYILFLKYLYNIKV